MYCELDENKILMGYSDHPSTVGIEINKPIPAFTSTQVVKWSGSDWVVEDSQTLIDEKSEYDAQEYARNRAVAYDSVGDQLDQLMKDMMDGTTTHQESCEAVKAKYPKP